MKREIPESIAGWSYQTCGSPGNPPVVFLHGFLGAGSDWEFLREAVAADYYCFLPDLPGHGQSLRSLPPQPLTLSGLAAGLARLLVELGLPAVHLVGYSMGGRIALTVAVDYPGLVSSVTLESASPGLAGREARRQRRRLDDQRAADILEHGLEEFVDAWYEMPLFASLQRNRELVERLKDRRKRNDRLAMGRIVKELSPGRQPSQWGKLKTIQSPALLLVGEYDRQYTAIMEQMAGAMPNARLQIIPGAGHNVHLENPEAYTRTLKAFLDSVAFFA